MIYIYVTFIICIVITLWLFIEPFCIRRRNIELYYDNLPEEFDGFSILHLSDIHTSKWGKFEELLCKNIAKFKESDICCITGDLAYTHDVACNIQKILSNGKIKGDTYIVFGNTEYKPHNDNKVFEKLYTDFGYKILRNSSIKIFRENNFISLIGLDDPINLLDDIKKAFKDVNKESFKIMMTHCPSMTIDGLDYGVNLVLAGHTHGGQVKLPFFMAYTHMVKNKFLNVGFWSAKKLGKKINRKINNFNLVISNGLGTSVLRIRMFAPPEMYRIVLRKN